MILPDLDQAGMIAEPRPRSSCCVIGQDSHSSCPANTREVEETVLQDELVFLPGES